MMSQHLPSTSPARQELIDEFIIPLIKNEVTQITFDARAHEFEDIHSAFNEAKASYWYSYKNAICLNYEGHLGEAQFITEDNYMSSLVVALDELKENNTSVHTLVCNLIDIIFSAEIAVRFFEKLSAKCPNIKTLYLLNDANNTDKLLAIKIMQLFNLKNLIINHVSIKIEGTRLIPHLAAYIIKNKDFRSLRIIGLQEMAWSADDITDICAMLQHPQVVLTELTLGMGKKWVSEMLNSLVKALQGNRSLRKLHFIFNYLSDRHIVAIAEILKNNKNICSIYAEDNNLKETNIYKLGSLEIKKAVLVHPDLLSLRLGQAGKIPTEIRQDIEGALRINQENFKMNIIKLESVTAEVYVENVLKFPLFAPIKRIISLKDQLEWLQHEYADNFKQEGIAELNMDLQNAGNLLKKVQMIIKNILCCHLRFPSPDNQMLSMAQDCIGIVLDYLDNDICNDENFAPTFFQPASTLKRKPGDAKPDDLTPLSNKPRV